MTRISREKAATLSQEDLYLALMEPVWDDTSRGTHGQKIFVTATRFVREVDNGGLAQAFHNFSLAEVESAIAAFTELGATDHAASVRTALTRMFDGGVPSSDEDLHAREESLSMEWIEEHFDDLDSQMYDERQLWPYFESYIRRNPEQFFLPPKEVSLLERPSERESDS